MTDDSDRGAAVGAAVPCGLVSGGVTAAAVATGAFAAAGMGAAGAKVARGTGAETGVAGGGVGFVAAGLGAAGSGGAAPIRRTGPPHFEQAAASSSTLNLHLGQYFTSSAPQELPGSCTLAVGCRPMSS